MSRPAHPRIGVGVVVFKATAEGVQVLLVKRRRPPREGEWSLPGGKQELGESIRETARREVREETGVEIDLLGLVDVVDSITPDPETPDGPPAFHYTLVDFAARWTAGEPTAGDDAAETVWADAEALEPYDLWDETCRIVGEARRIYRV